MDFFYRQHPDLRPNVPAGTTVETLTEAGLAKYFTIRRGEEPELTANISLIIDYDLEAGPEFSPQGKLAIIKGLSRSSGGGRVSFVIHRDGHTVSLMREGNTFLLLDSYNAHGAPDADHIPLLRLLRMNFPCAKIYTLRDKMQNDFYTCKIFALENLIAIEKYCETNGCGLMGAVVSNSEIYFKEPDTLKDEPYEELRVTAVGIPTAILPHVQSICLIRAVLCLEAKEEKLRELLGEHLDLGKTKPINRTITATSNRIREIIASSVEGKIFPTSQREFVESCGL